MCSVLILVVGSPSLEYLYPLHPPPTHTLSAMWCTFGLEEFYSIDRLVDFLQFWLGLEGEGDVVLLVQVQLLCWHL